MGNSISLDPILTEEKSSNRFIFMMIYENEELYPVSVYNYVLKTELFYSKPFVLIEPIKTNNIKESEIFLSKVSYTEVVTFTTKTFNIYPTQTKNEILYVFIPKNLKNDLVTIIISKIKNYPLEFINSKSLVTVSKIFFETILPLTIGEVFKKKPLASRNTQLTIKPSTTNNIIRQNSFDTNSIGDKILTFNSNYNDSIDNIISGLYISGEEVASNLSLLKAKNITHILDLTGNTIKFPNDFIYKTINLKDSVFEELNEEFWNSLFYIQNVISNGSNILVHCQKGISRSAALCLAYLIKNKGFPYENALKIIQEKRPIININSGFIDQIKIKLNVI